MSTKLLPTHAFFIAGKGKHRDRLQAFDRALLDAGPIAHNLVPVSSILPAKCKIIKPGKGFGMLTLGQITFCVMAKEDTNKKNHVASAAVGVVKPKKSKSFGYISEYHGNTNGITRTKMVARQLAIELYANKFNKSATGAGLEFADATAASIRNTGGGEWVCAVALCVFVT